MRSFRWTRKVKQKRRSTLPLAVPTLDAPDAEEEVYDSEVYDSEVYGVAILPVTKIRTDGYLPPELPVIPDASGVQVPPIAKTTPKPAETPPIPGISLPGTPAAYEVYEVHDIPGVSVLTTTGPQAPGLVYQGSDFYIGTQSSAVTTSPGQEGQDSPTIPGFTVPTVGGLPQTTPTPTETETSGVAVPATQKPAETDSPLPDGLPDGYIGGMIPSATKVPVPPPIVPQPDIPGTKTDPITKLLPEPELPAMFRGTTLPLDPLSTVYEVYEVYDVSGVSVLAMTGTQAPASAFQTSDFYIGTQARAITTSPEQAAQETPTVLGIPIPTVGGIPQVTPTPTVETSGVEVTATYKTEEPHSPLPTGLPDEYIGGMIPSATKVPVPPPIVPQPEIPGTTTTPTGKPTVETTPDPGRVGPSISPAYKTDDTPLKGLPEEYRGVAVPAATKVPVPQPVVPQPDIPGTQTTPVSKPTPDPTEEPEQVVGIVIPPVAVVPDVEPPVLEPSVYTHVFERLEVYQMSEQLFAWTWQPPGDEPESEGWGWGVRGFEE